MQANENDSPRASFDRAMTFLRGGDAQMAEKLCRQALGVFPRDANLLCLLGAAMLKQNKPREAEHTLTRAVRMYPTFARAQETLADALIMQGRLHEALESLERAEELEPGVPSIRFKKGKVLDGLGREDEASQAVEASIKLTPHKEELVRGLQLQRMGNVKEAEKIFRDVLVHDPDNVDALRLLAGVAMRAKQWGDAEVLLERALEITPDYFQCIMDLGVSRQEMDRIDDALDAYRRAARADDSKPHPWSSAGTCLAMAGEHDDAVEMFNEALKREPGFASALSGLGHVLKTVGKQDEAIASYRECVKHNVWNGEAWWSLANLKTFRFEPDEIETMKQQLAREELNDEIKANLHFALGKASEDAGDHATAFEHYKNGNDNRRERESFDPVQHADSHDQAIQVFSKDFFAQRKGWGYGDNSPIFIVGLPRSGSTLIEQILASHPMVEGTHELPDLGRVVRSTGLNRQDRVIYPELLNDYSAEQVEALGKQYIERTQRHRTEGAAHFTDKMPNNFAHSGLVRLILPNAKIINARRHPLDSCLGSYKQLFARGQPFTYDLYELGEYYLEYMRLMEHWHTVMPGHVLDVQYEDVVDDLESQVRRILEYCDLPWDDACLRFYESDRAVKTASSEQVRKPIYASSKHRWRNYEQELEPLIEVLEPLLKELPADWQPDSIRD